MNVSEPITVSRMKRSSLFARVWWALVFVALVVFTVVALSGSDDSPSHNHHPITVLERKVDRIKAKQSAQIAADRHTLHQLTRAMELLP